MNGIEARIEETIRRLASVSFQEAQRVLQEQLGRKLRTDERNVLAKHVKARISLDAVRARALQEEEFLLHHERNFDSCGFIVCTAYSSNYRPGDLVSGCNEQYARKYGYEDIKVTKSKESILKEISPRTVDKKFCRFIDE